MLFGRINPYAANVENMVSS